MSLDPRYFNYHNNRHYRNSPSFNSQHVMGSMQYYLGGALNSKPIHYQQPQSLNQREHKDKNSTNNNIQENSSLSNYGRNSLSLTAKQISYQLNNNKLNPISHQTKQYIKDIEDQKQKIQLDEKDIFYYQQQKLLKNNQIQSKTNNNANQPMMAGKNTQKQDPKKLPIQNQQYKNYVRNFRPKMLNHIDQLNGLI